ncbi:hypothetical protein C84B14_11052 [Salinisphaera sp. C84B14]|uniref:hypothetical protein n=1 Tax=Salinisphaera sp. C84B14 TaxID=1304155 RepID=UPI00334242EA
MARLAAISVALIGGYVYRVKNGPLIYADDGVEIAVKCLAFFVLGCGAILGPFKTLIIGNVFGGFSFFVALAVVAISVPLSGMSVLGAMLVGSLFRHVQS